MISFKIYNKKEMRPATNEEICSLASNNELHFGWNKVLVTNNDKGVTNILLTNEDYVLINLNT